MDRTQDFIKYASSFSTQQVLHRQMISPSPFIIKATEVVRFSLKSNNFPKYVV